jgi:tetratricopeptide (TPR) repeat protein
MSGHVAGEIADYIEGLMKPDRARAFEAHISSCPDCAADLDYARSLQTGGLQQGLMHIRPARIVSLAGERETVSEIEAQHLKRCESCRAELEWVRESSKSDPMPGGGVANGIRAARSAIQRPRSSRSRYRAWGLGLAAVSAAVVLFLMVLPDGSMDTDTARGLARVEAIPVNITRRPVPPDSFAEKRLRGLEEYRDGRYESARAYFERAAEIQPADSEILLFLGSAAMLVGDHDAAAKHLLMLVEGTNDEGLRMEGLWQLANSYLAVGRVEEAKSLLGRVRDTGGLRADEATTLLRQLND